MQIEVTPGRVLKEHFPTPPLVKLSRFHLTQFIDVPPNPCDILHSWIIKRNPSEALEVQSTFAGGVKPAGFLRASRAPGEEEDGGRGLKRQPSVSFGKVTRSHGTPAL